MSMGILTIIQTSVIFCVYTLLVIGIPALVFGNRMEGRRLGERLLFYYLFGNFYIMNLVFVLQLLRISNRFTLIVFTFVPAFVMWQKHTSFPIKNTFLGFWDNFRRFTGGQLGARNAFLRFRHWVWANIKRFFKWSFKLFYTHFFEWILIAILVAAVVYINGTHLYYQYGYSTSDIPVHNYWINGMLDNEIFVAGVYPFGFHCIIYFLHVVFGLETYVMLRVFGVVQAVYIFLILAGFIRLSCKTKYIGYAVTIALVVFNGFSVSTYERYISPLPQEYGMLFILPGIYFLFRFFEVRREEIRSGLMKAIKEEKRQRKAEKKERKAQRKAGKKTRKATKSEKPSTKAEKRAEKEAARLERKSEKEAAKLEKENGKKAAKTAKKEEKEAAKQARKERKASGKFKKSKWEDDWIEIEPDDDEPEEPEYVTGTEDYGDSVPGTEATDYGEPVSSMRVAEEPVAVVSAERIEQAQAEDWRDPKDAKEESFEEEPEEGETEEEDGEAEIEQEDEEEEEEKGKKKRLWLKESIFCLACFGMSFSMTLAVHFYDTMIAGLFCVGIAVGFVWWIIRPKYFLHILAAGFLAVLIAVLPMAISFAAGTPLQGSLGWGMEIIAGDNEEDTESLETDGTEADDTEEFEDSQGEDTESTEGGESSGGSGDRPESGKPSSGESGQKPVQPSVAERLSNIVFTCFQHAVSVMTKEFLTPEYGWLSGFILLSVAALFVMGLFYWVVWQEFYGSRMIATAVYMFLLTAMLISGRIGLPSLMNVARSVIYYAYSIPIVLALLADGVFYLVRLVVRWKRSMQILSLAAAGSLVWFIVFFGMYREPVKAEPMETNGAIICLTNILREEEDNTWIIVSANDEREMISGHGYHYELITFLRQMEYFNQNSRVTLASPTVYFFIEKIPVDYAGAYEGSGRVVSYSGANHPLYYGVGNKNYWQEERYRTMSRIYFWAQAFQRLYPSEMQVYLETEEFVCYRLTQNPYQLFNLAIDYEFNSKTYKTR